MIQQAIESVTRRDTNAPRTILGFLLAMYGVLIAASATVVLGLVASDSKQLIPYVLGFGALVTVALGVAIIAIAWKDPSRLMLGQVSASEYASIRRLNLGDNQRGEQPTRVIGSTVLAELEEVDDSSVSASEAATPAELAGPDDEDEDQGGVNG